MIPGPAGALEVQLAVPADYQTGQPVAVVCHPHSLHGGSMTNKVVHMLCKTLLEMNVVCVRFNFRGVGGSEGQFDNGVGETGDLLAVVDWLRARYPHTELWQAGFSFGAYVALRARSQTAASRVLLVAPPVDMFDFGGLKLEGSNDLVIQGSRDEIVDASSVRQWIEQQDPPPSLLMLDGASHFFHARLNDLRTALKQGLLENSPGTAD